LNDWKKIDTDILGPYRNRLETSQWAAFARKSLEKRVNFSSFTNDAEKRANCVSSISM